MEKIINIDGRDIPFKATGSIPLRYKQQFQRDYFADTIKLERFANALVLAVNTNGKNGIRDINMDAFDSEVLYDICWIFAKCADNSIQTPFEWLDTFESFPLADIIPEIQDLIYSSVTTTKVSKN